MRQSPPLCYTFFALRLRTYADYVQERGAEKDIYVGEEVGENYDELHSNAVLDGQDIWHLCRRREMGLGFWLRHLKQRDCLEDLGVDSMIILRCLKEIGWENAWWIYLAQDGYR
jgi:hypothetical protein